MSFDMDEDDSTTASSFSTLKDEPLKVQLEALFGAYEADQFLNPTFQDRVKNSTCPSTISKDNNGPIGVEELWDSLRLQSQHKLAQRTPDKHGYSRRTNFMTDEQKLERKVVVYRQRLQLMHRIALLNVSKSRKLITKLNLPKITGDWNANMMPEEREKLGSCCIDEDAATLLDDNCIKLPQINNNNNITSSKDNFIQNQKKIEILMDNKPQSICFVSNKELTVSGQFHERMKRHHGVESSVGISNASHFYKKQKKKRHSNLKTQTRIEDGSNEKTSPTSNSFVASKKGTLWHPLSMGTIMECLDNLSLKKTVNCV